MREMIYNGKPIIKQGKPIKATFQAKLGWDGLYLGYGNTPKITLWNTNLGTICIAKKKLYPNEAPLELLSRWQVEGKIRELKYN